MDNKSKILIVFPFVLVIILVFAADIIPFEGEFSEAERRILEFTPSDLNIREVEKIHTGRALKGPFDFEYSGDINKGDVENSDSARKVEYDDADLSLIVISGMSKMAIINGNIVKEGDRIDGMKIVKIEPDRVLLKNRTTQWLYPKE